VVGVGVVEVHVIVDEGRRGSKRNMNVKFEIEEWNPK
jgi:hypothetical protein